MIKLYHGSTVAVRKPSLRPGRPNADFGKGFYTTTNYDQAVRWAHIKQEWEEATRAVVSVYEFDKTLLDNPELNIRKFTGADESWLYFVTDCRKSRGHNYDLVQGPVANDKVIFTGSIFGADKDAAFRHCYAFCIPSTLEGLPMSLLEAMSYGKIAIASDIPACHEALGESGIYAPYEDDKAICEAMQELESNEAKYEWQKEANKQRAQSTFSWRIPLRSIWNMCHVCEKGLKTAGNSVNYCQLVKNLL